MKKMKVDNIAIKDISGRFGKVAIQKRSKTADEKGKRASAVMEDALNPEPEE